MKIGIIGVGTMGSRMVANLIAADYEVLVCDINNERASQAQKMGAVCYAKPCLVAEHASVILMSLPLPSDVATVFSGSDGILAGAGPGHIVVDLSTVDPYSTQENAVKADEKGIGYLDAPVLGRPQGCGRWTLPVGGGADNLEKVRPVLEVFAKNIIHVGPPGHGNIIKLLNNMMFGAINTVTAEIMGICMKVGMKPKILYETIAASGAASVSNLFIELGPKMIYRDFAPLFTVDLLYKDLQLALEMAGKAGVPAMVGHQNQLVNGIARSMGLGSEDTSSVVKVYENFLGEKISNNE